jgi:hypothetical protein
MLNIEVYTAPAEKFRNSEFMQSTFDIQQNWGFKASGDSY